MNWSRYSAYLLTAFRWLIQRWEPVIALSSLVIAACAFYVAWATANMSQTHNVVSTRPILLFGVGNLPVEKEVYFEVRNVGLGPAVITNFELYKDGEPLMPFPSYALSMLTALNIRHEGFSYQNIHPPLVIGPGQNVLMLSLPKEIYEPVVAQAFRKGSEHIAAVACYCGLYEDQCYFTGPVKIPANSCATRAQYNPLKGRVGETPKGTQTGMNPALASYKENYYFPSKALAIFLIYSSFFILVYAISRIAGPSTHNPAVHRTLRDKAAQRR